MNRIMSDVEQKNGCRAVGWFEIDRVPGNFHFSSHGYGSFIPELISKGIRNAYTIQVTLICRIKSNF